MRVRPVGSAVAVQLRPVVVPGFGAVVGFGDVMIALAVSAVKYDFVGRPFWAGLDEM